LKSSARGRGRRSGAGWRAPPRRAGRVQGVSRACRRTPSACAGAPPRPGPPPRRCWRPPAASPRVRTSSTKG